MRSAQALLAFAVLASTFAAAPAEAAFTREPWVQNAGKDTAAIYWEAGSTGGTQTLKWGQGTALDQTVAGTQINALAKVYKAVLTGLPSSTSFSWQVVSNSDTSSVGSFVTAPPDDAPQPFKFGVYGDNRTNTSDHAAVVAAMIQQAPDFVVNTGDLADVLTTGFNYNQFFSIEKALLYDVPIFPTPGNHDIIQSYQFGFDRPNYYSFRWANAFFLCISASGADSYASGSAQYNWAEQQLSTASADPTIQWIFAVHHFPVYSSATHGSTADMQTSLNPLYKQYHVDAVFNGHDHDYERVEQDGIEYFVAGGGGAPLYDTGTLVTGSVFHVKANSILTVDLDGGIADFKAFKTDGTMVDSKHIEKGPASTPTPTPSPTPTGTGTGTPTPNPTGTPGGNGANGGCDVGGFGASASPMLATLGALAMMLARRRKKTS